MLKKWKNNYLIIINLNLYYDNRQVLSLWIIFECRYENLNLCSNKISIALPELSIHKDVKNNIILIILSYYYRRIIK